MKVLVLTDHARHTAANSLYVLARALARRCREVRVASRGTPGNAAFFACAPQNALHAVRVGDDFAFAAAGGAFASAGGGVDTPLDWPDAVVLRVPHPVPAGWFEFLPRAFPGRPIANNPSGIAATTSKAWLLNVRELCAPIALCRSPDEVIAFAKTRDAVLKPLDGYGGAGVLRVCGGWVEVPQPSGPTRIALADWPRHPLARSPYLAMQYLSRVDEGDKRIVVAGDQTLGAVLRVPAQGEWLCNVSRGGRAEAAEVSFAERRMVEVLAPRMRALGVVIFGIDTLVGDDGERVLSEVNTMSVGGFNDLPDIGDRSAADIAADEILATFAASPR